MGYTLDELRNEITGGATPASFEPAIDYVVTKIPRFTFEKFPNANDRLTTQMKSVGEVMAIGRNFQESMQKALRGLEVGSAGFEHMIDVDAPEAREELITEITRSLERHLQAEGYPHIAAAVGTANADWAAKTYPAAPTAV